MEFVLQKTVIRPNYGKKYFTSSKEVKILREKFGEPDIIELDKTFMNVTPISVS